MKTNVDTYLEVHENRSLNLNDLSVVVFKENDHITPSHYF